MMFLYFFSSAESQHSSHSSVVNAHSSGNLICEYCDEFIEIAADGVFTSDIATAAFQCQVSRGVTSKYYDDHLVVSSGTYHDRISKVFLRTAHGIHEMKIETRL